MSTRPIIITPKDLSALEALLDAQEFASEIVRQAARDKIAQAHVVFASDLPRDAISIGTRVSFQINDLNPIERVLTKDPDIYPLGSTQSFATSRGIALLGLREGASATAMNETGSETIRVMRILFQPEAADSYVTTGSLSSVIPMRPKNPTSKSLLRPAGAPYWDDDDPGPSAA